VEGKVELETLFYEPVAEGVVMLTLNRPEFGNGVVVEMAHELMRAFNEFEADRGVRVLILTGAGRQFCAGADLHAFKRYLEERLPIEQEPFNARVLFPVTQRLVALRMPVIAAINGGATAGGLDLAMACDLRIASTKAKLGETYINVGLPPGNGGSYFLPRLLGSGLAAELAFTGDVIDGERALAIGLINRLVEPESLIEEATSLATRIAAKPARALEATKQALRTSWQCDLQGMMASSYWTVAALNYSDDLKEGIDAAIEKRPPRFNARRPE
jgi:enoyl-CoA hydratase